MKISRTWRSLRERIGPRGDVLLALGVIDVGQAISLVRDQPSASYEWFGSIAPLQAWAALWLGAAVVCIYHAFRRDDHFGYVAAVGIKLVWGVGCFAAWILADVTALGGVLWLMFSVIIWRVAGYLGRLDISEDLEP